MLGLIERGGDVVIRMMVDVKQATIEPVIKATIAAGSQVMTDEYDIYGRLRSWCYQTQDNLSRTRRERAR